VPDFDLRYRKSLPFRGRTIVGFYSSPVADVQNIWFDGLGHMSCAYSALGNYPRANFYANQLDGAIIDHEIDGTVTRAIPYALNTNGDYSWVNVNEGIVSTAAWYIFAKQRFNPLLLERAPAEGDP
jgi:hypothetical protein